jgi:hypothetical protein
MGLFDSYFDPQQFEAGGGLVGRMLSLQQQQGQYQPADGFGLPYGQAPERANMPEAAVSASGPIPPVLQNLPPPPAWQTPDYGQTQNIPIGNYQMPQFGRPEPPQPAPQPPDLGARLGAGFQSWAHTPVGNPFAALANGITGYTSGQRVPAPTPQEWQLRRDVAQWIPGDQNAPPQNSGPFAQDRLLPQAQPRAAQPRPNIGNRRWRSGYGG